MRKQNQWVLGTVWILSMLLLPGLAAATTYYVDDGGNDGNSGTSASSPWKTISHAAGAISGGTAADPNVIRIAAGIYDQAANGESFPIEFNGNYIQLVGTGAASVIIDTTQPDSSTRDALRVHGTGFSVSGITFKKAQKGTEFFKGGFTVDDCVFENTVTKGITFNRSDSNLSSNVSYGDMAISGNTFQTSSNGVEIYIGQVFDGTTENLTVTIGSLSVTGNTFAVGSGAGIAINGLYISNLINGTATVGKFTISSNNFTGGDQGVAIISNRYLHLQDTQLTTDITVISGNRFTDQVSSAIRLGNLNVNDVKGHSTVSLGGLTVQSNTINSDATAHPNCRGIVTLMNMINQIGDESTVNLPAVTVTNNRIAVADAALFLGGAMVSGVGQQYWDDTAAVVVGATSVSSNRLTSAAGVGIYITESGIMSTYGRSRVTRGALSITGNTVRSDDAACMIQDSASGTSMHEDSVLLIKPITITNNSFTSVNGNALDISQNSMAAGLLDNASVKVQSFTLSHNTVISDAFGVIFQLSSAGIGMQDKASLYRGPVRIDQNTIKAATSAGMPMGIYVTYNSVGTNNQGPVSVTVEDISITGNTISDVSGMAVYFNYNSIGSVNVGTGQVKVGDVDISENTLETVGIGLYVQMAGIQTDSGVSVTVGDLNVTGNSMTGVSQFGVSANYQAQNHNPGIATLGLGAANIGDNSISGTGAAVVYGIFMAANIPTPGVVYGKTALSGNSVSGFQNGIYLANDIESAEVQCNIVENNMQAGLFIDSDESFTVENNAFVGNGMGLQIAGGKAAVVTAEKNWWGDAAGPAACTSCNKIDAGGGSVDYTPWLRSIYAMQCSKFPWPMFMPAVIGGRQ